MTSCEGWGQWAAVSCQLGYLQPGHPCGLRQRPLVTSCETLGLIINPILSAGQLGAISHPTKETDKGGDKSTIEQGP